MNLELVFFIIVIGLGIAWAIRHDLKTYNSRAHDDFV